MPSHIAFLLTQARRVLMQNQRQLGEMVGVSLRTVQRWETKVGYPSAGNIQAVADAVRPHDPALASEMDTFAPRPVPPPPVDSPSAEKSKAPPPAPVLVDSVVCAAAEATALAPQAIRPAVLAAFVRARDAGLTPDEVIAVLSPPSH